MTKAELIEAMEGFPDDIEIRMGVRKDNCTYSIDRLGKFQGNHFIILEPGGAFYEGE